MRLALGAAALAVLMPPHAFAGAGVIDWIGLAAAATLLTINWLQRRAEKQTAPRVAGP